MANAAANYPSWVSNIRWYHGAGSQAECFAKAKLDQAFIKWDRGSFASIPAWTPAFFDYMHDLAPRGYQGVRPARFLCLVPSDRPSVFYMDIEWYAESKESLSEAEVSRRVKLCLTRLENYWDDHQNHATEEDCFYKHYVSDSSRDTGKPYDAISQKDGYKFSFHVCTRCTHGCHFACFDDLRLFGVQFLQYLHNHKEHFPDMWYGRDKLQCMIDPSVYTKNRALRLPLCAKKAGDLVVFQPCDSHTNSVNDLIYHVHGYVEPESLPVDVDVSVEIVDQRTGKRTTARRTHAVHPAPEVTERAHAVRRILHSLDRPDLGVTNDGHRLYALDINIATVASFLEGEYTLEQRGYWRPYERWFAMSLYLLQAFMGTEHEDHAYELWLNFCKQIDKCTTQHNPEKQWRYSKVMIEQRRQISGNAATADNSRILTMLSRGFGRDYRDIAGAADDVLLIKCIVDPTKWHATMDTWIPATENYALILYCNHCDASRFMGFEYETDVALFDTRYVNQYDRLMNRLNKRITYRCATRSTAFVKRTVVVPAQMGTGKTELLKLLRETTANTRILILGMRVLLTRDMFNRLNGGADPVLPQLVHYQDSERELHTYNQVVLQLDSLLRIVHTGNTPRYDILVLEEIESLLAHLSSSTLAHKRRLIGDVLGSLVRNAGLVLVLDADIGARGYEFLAQARPDTPPSIYRNLATPLARLHMVDKSLVAWMSRMVSKAVAGERFFVVSNSKSKLDMMRKVIENRIGDDKVLLYSSSSPDSLKRSVSGCSRDWLNYQIVMWTPVISAGVNFDPPVAHFQCGFLYATDRSSCARDILQQQGRVRKLVEGSAAIIHTYINQSLHKENLAALLTVNDVADYVQRNLSEMLSPTMLSIAERVHMNIGAATLMLDRADPLTNALLHNSVEVNRSQADFLKEYRTYCRMHGDRFVDATPIEYCITLAEVQLLGKQAVVEYHESLATAERLAHSVTDGEDDVAPESRLKEAACRLIGVDDITNADAWAVLRDPGFKTKLLTFMMAVHPNQDEANGALSVLMANPRIERDESRQLVFTDYMIYLEKVALYQQTPVSYESIHRRVDVTRVILDHLELNKATDTASYAQCAQAYDQLLETVGIDILGPLVRGIRIHKRPHRPELLYRRIKAILKEVSGINLRGARGKVRLDMESLGQMWEFAVLSAPTTFAETYKELGVPPGWFADKVKMLTQ